MEAFRNKVNAVCRAVYAAIVKGSPPEPCEDVCELFDSLGIKKRQQLMMYTVFHALRQNEREEVVKTAIAVEFDSVKNVIPTRRRWCSQLLTALLELGGCEVEEEVDWDSFLYILVQFCSLSKVELCQALFLMILKCLESEKHHYITMDQLIEFYSFYAKCPVTSFNTRAIDFSRLPLRRYYVQDFTELVQRFTVLLNPCIHLQRSLQESLPSVEFWDNHHRSEVIIRKITYDFFQMEKTRCFLWGEPPFRESCDMLGPEALGFLAINRDQWDMRTFDLHERVGALSDGGSLSRDKKLMAPPGYQYRSLRQFSVWGEQPNPEEVERMMFEENENVYISSTGYINVKADKDLNAGKVKTEEEKAAEKEKKRQIAKEKAMKGLAVEDGEIDPLRDPAVSCLRAACLDESMDPPPKDMPPTWMKGASIAPAPRVIGANPPLRLVEMVPAGNTQSAFYNSATSFGANRTGGFQQTQGSWGQTQGSFGTNQTGGMSPKGNSRGFGTQNGMNQTGQSNSKSKSQVQFK